MFLIIVVALLFVTSESTDDFLANWMSHLHPVVKQQTLLDLTLPGSHDTLTYDLSEVVAQGANDIPVWLSDLLHLLPKHLVGPYVRSVAQTQVLTVTEQLDNGIRFLDCRIMRTAGPDRLLDPEWYSLHFLESRQKATVYLQQVRDWLNAHPTEIVVIWFSRHGSACATGDSQYPDVPNTAKLAFWREVEAIFSGLLFDQSVSSIGTTTIAELLERDQRVFIYAADYANFTANSKLALDSCFIDNQSAGLVPLRSSSLDPQLRIFQKAAATRSADKPRNRFYLQSLAQSSPVWLGEDEAAIWYLHDESAIRHCAQRLGISNVTDWCPQALLDLGQVVNYYTQPVLEIALLKDWEFPNALYLDAIGFNGTLRTGVGLASQTGYAYVDTLLLRNVRRACKAENTSRSLGNETSDCTQLDNMLSKRRSRFPVAKQDDPAHGRLVGWP
eukprot:NODE_197_length_2801_cov_21.947311_g180_i0.p1 GENE.NODE_197_length_2801_cov_21.947311_g180_i0~~NODE_197_length_2801_cov_21.947311_g180_i0.p1  ORF type:complete len:444 (+),score=63.35 NODE_197_length_2801_cov_21.947311_g180_i0:1416-2747(+)